VPRKSITLHYEATRLFYWRINTRNALSGAYTSSEDRATRAITVNALIPDNVITSDNVNKTASDHVITPSWSLFYITKLLRYLLVITLSVIITFISCNNHQPTQRSRYSDRNPDTGSGIPLGSLPMWHMHKTWCEMM